MLVDAFSELANSIETAFVFGSMATGKHHARSDLDICVLGDVTLLEVVKALGPVQDDLSREVNPTVMSVTDFVKQYEDRNRFAERIVDEPKIFVIGDESEFEKLIENRATR